MKKTERALAFPQPVREAVFLRRRNRFLVEGSVDGRTVRAHLPNPGRLRELLLPGRTLLLAPAEAAAGRKTGWTAAGVLRNGDPIMLHTHYTNRAARWLLERGLVPGMEGWEVRRGEVGCGRSRFDFLLSRSGEELFVEVKSCTLLDGAVAMFPDAITARGRRHVLELAELAREGRRTCVLFIVHSPRARILLPDYHTDPAFAEALYGARGDVFIKAVGVSWDRSLSLSGAVRDLPVPWDVYRREAGGGGAYLIVLRLPRKRRIVVGSLGDVVFQKGYYVYVGSGRRGLFARLNRHRRGGAGRHWHLDYLRQFAGWRESLAVQTRDDIECDLAKAVSGLGGEGVPGFGSSDCRCPSHLVTFKEDPMKNGAFVDMVLHFRMGRLAPRAGKRGGESAKGEKR